MKLLIRVAVVGLLGLLLLAGTVLFLGNRVARAGLERAGSRALGAETSVGSLRIGLVSGHLGLAGLSVANPAPFEGGEFLSLDHGELEVSLGTLTGERIVAPLLALSGIELRLERRAGETNFGQVLASLERAAGSGSEDEGGKRFVLKRVEIRDVSALVDLIEVGGELTEFTVTLPELVLEDMGADGAPLERVVAELVHALFAGVLEAGAGVLPADLLADLRADLAALGAELSALGEGLLEEAAGELGEALGEAGKVLESQVEEAVKEAGDALEDVFGDKDGR